LKKNIAAISEEVKPGWSNSRRNEQIWQNVPRKAMPQKGSLANDLDEINNIPQ
jgi:hypothetical protein